MSEQPENETYDDRIYSDTSIGDQRLTWREVVERVRQENRDLHRFAQLVTDLDRNANGRHEGDVDFGDPTGVSQGNPLMTTGTVVGYSIAGDDRPYVMPERGQRHDPQAWGAR